jgi:PDGLE domain
MTKASSWIVVVLALALAVGLASAVAPFASPNPDGLEKVAEEKRFLNEGRLAPIQEDSPLPDYAFPGVGNERLATGVAGFAGTLAVFATGYGLALVVRRRPRSGTGARSARMNRARRVSAGRNPLGSDGHAL